MKIDRALIIRRLQNQISMEYADGCAKSCEEFGLPYEFIDAVENLPCEEAYASVGVKTKNGYSNNNGNCGCHSSHIKAWKRIVELDKPCIILEHDALVRGDVTNIDIPDMVVITFGHRIAEHQTYTPIGPATKFIEVPKAVGVHACGLSPVTAIWLYDDAVNNGIGVGIDRWLFMQKLSGLPIYVCEPPQVACWVRKSTTNMDLGKPDIVKASVKNYHEALTEAWNQGLKNG